GVPQVGPGSELDDRWGVVAVDASGRRGELDSAATELSDVPGGRVLENVMPAAQQREVGGRGLAAVRVGDGVVGIASVGPATAAGPAAVLVARVEIATKLCARPVAVDGEGFAGVGVDQNPVPAGGARGDPSRGAGIDGKIGRAHV